MTGFCTASLRLIAITPGRGDVAAIIAFARAALAGGATAVWLRERERSIDEQMKLVAEVRRIADAHAGVVIVSGADARLIEAGAHALQLGRHEPAPAAVRARVGVRSILGYSAHDPLDVVASASADFIVLAPLFAVPGKAPALGLARFGELARAVPVPVVGLGGIDASNAADVIAAGAAGVAVQRAIVGAPDPEAAARALRSALDPTG